jgi:hypothetical protein
VALAERMISVHDEPILLTDINLEEHRVTFDKDIQSGTINELQMNLNNSFFNKKKYFLVCLIHIITFIYCILIGKNDKEMTKIFYYQVIINGIIYLIFIPFKIYEIIFQCR